MNTFINFLVDNYIWFIGITVFLLFSLIGFLVENNKNGPKKEKDKKEEKPRKEKKKKLKKEKKKDDILEDNVPTVEEAIQQEKQAKDNKNENTPKSDNNYDTPIIIEEKNDD